MDVQIGIIGNLKNVGVVKNVAVSQDIKTFLKKSIQIGELNKWK